MSENNKNRDALRFGFYINRSDDMHLSNIELLSKAHRLHDTMTGELHARFIWSMRNLLWQITSLDAKAIAIDYITATKRHRFQQLHPAPANPQVDSDCDVIFQAIRGPL